MALWLPTASIADLSVLNEEERAYFANYAEESAQFLTDMLADVDQEHWHYRSAPERWTIAECAEHILIAEQNILRQVKQTIAEQTPQPSFASAIPTDDMVLTLVCDRINKRVKTIEVFEPQNKWATKTEFLTAFSKHRAEAASFMASAQAPMRQLSAKSPFGPIDLYQYMLVSLAHGARHTLQIEDIKAQLGLSTTIIAFGGPVKVSYPISVQPEVRQLFRDVLHQQMEEREGVDIIHFAQDGLLAVVYQEEEALGLTPAQYRQSMWVALDVPSPQYDSVKRRLKAFGVTELYPDGDQSNNYYFHAPGGQVFRLRKK